MTEYFPLGRSEEMSEGEYQGLPEPDHELMGEFAYEAACNEIADRADRPPSALLQPAGVWKTRDGRVLNVSEMQALHLHHAIRLFERAGWGEHPKLQELREELAKR